MTMVSTADGLAAHAFEHGWLTRAHHPRAALLTPRGQTALVLARHPPAWPRGRDRPDPASGAATRQVEAEPTAPKRASLARHSARPRSEG